MIDRLLGLTGLIGSGKSMVASGFARLGLPVYDSDRRAKELMVRGGECADSIIEIFGTQAYVDGVLNRQFIASKIFNDSHLRACLESIIHPAVERDIEHWRAANDGEWGVVESAILIPSGINRLMDAVVVVNAPTAVRLARVMARDGAQRNEVERRMAAQMDQNELNHYAHWCIENNGKEELTDKIALIYEKMTNFANQ
ncbi:MAG: dephospho-CoA kinase [Mucinivorans sp.]